MAKVSVVVPIYNAEKYLKQCLDSVVNQTLKDIEIILINDGSTDGSEEICKHYLSDQRVKYYSKVNAGAVMARRDGISYAQGEFIGFVDADDYVTTDMCEKMYQAGVTADADICVCDYEIIFDNANKETYTDLLRGGLFDRQQIREEVLSKFLGHIDGCGNIAKFDWAIIRRFFKRDFLVKNGLLFDETLSNSEDCLFAYLATHMASSMVYLKDEKLYINIRNAKSMTRRYLSNYWQQRCRIIDVLEEIISANTSAWQTEFFPLFVMRCVRPSFTNIAYGFGKVSPFKSIREFSAIVKDARVRKMCATMHTEGLSDEWVKLFNWCRGKRYFTLYFYFMDVQHHNKLCHFIRRVQKAVERRLIQRKK